MEKFDFLNLPSVVQDIITEKVVHDFSPENRLQFALTSKYCNELVKRAQPKKIIRHLKFLYPFHLAFRIEINSKIYRKTMDEMMEMLTDCQVEVLEFENMDFLLKSSDFSDILDKSLEFVTKLIIGQMITKTATIVDFYLKFRHLDTLVYKQNPLILPHYPPNIVVESNDGFSERSYINFFEDLAKFSRQNPLSSVKIKSEIFFLCFRQFLTTVRFLKDAEIFANFYMPDSSGHQIYLTYIGGDIFQFEIYSSETRVVTVDQRITGENGRIFALSGMNLKLAMRPDVHIPFNVTSASSGNQPIYSGILTRNEQEFKLENVKANDWIKVKFTSENNNFQVRYSADFLIDNFPRCDFSNYLDKINNVLGTKIGITNATLIYINIASDIPELFHNITLHQDQKDVEWII